MRYFLLISLLLSASTITLAQTQDSLVRFSDIGFKSELEKETFRIYGADPLKADIIDLFLTTYGDGASYSSSQAHQQIEACLADLKKETSGMGEVKKLKFIYREIHKRFFKVYRLQNSFSDIFSKGEYNCVSASALYAIIFERLSIPYQVMEAPKHVYLVAYPSTHKILVESTNPQAGYFEFNPAFIGKFVKYMYESKLISKEEYDNNAAETLFNRYYFEKRALNIRELASIQYCNYSVYHVEEKNYTQSLEDIKKAYYLNPSDKNKYNLQSQLSYAVSNCDYKNESDIAHLSMLCRFNVGDDKEISQERIKYEFGRLTESQLINRSDYSAYERSFDKIYNSVLDTALKKELAFHYHYELARLGYLNMKPGDYEMTHLKEAYKCNPVHANLQSLVLGFFARECENSSDPVFIIKQLDEFSSNFSFIEKNDRFNSIKADCLLEKAFQNYNGNEILKAEKDLSDFELFCTPGSNFKPGEKYVEKAYATAAAYYYKKGNISKSRQILKTGISYAPDNYGLKARLGQLK